MRRLLARFPYCAAVAHTPVVRAPTTRAHYVERVRATRNEAELVDAFLAHVREGEGASEREARLIAEVVEQRAHAEVTA